MKDEDIEAIALEEKDRIKAVLAANETAWNRAMALVNIQHRLQSPVAGPRWWQWYTFQWCPQCGERLSRTKPYGRFSANDSFVFQLDHDTCACGYEYAAVGECKGRLRSLNNTVLEAAER